MTQYVLMVLGSDGSSENGGYESPEQQQAQWDATGRFNDKLREQGRFVYANGLGAASASTVVDGRGAEPIVTDGPFLESKEYVIGLWIIEADDLDQALALAAEGSLACQRKVEVRPAHGAG